jgi:hypothetical protein
MYLALRPPWAHPTLTPTQDAGVIVEAPSDAGVAPGKKKKKGHHPRPPGTQGALPTIDSTFGPDDSDDGPEETEVTVAKLTGADRALEWKGEDTTPGPQKLDMSSGSSNRALDDGEINSVVGSQANGVRDCIVQGATGTDLRGTITVQMLVGGNGKVSKTRVQAPHYMFEKGLLNCVQRATGRMKFPAVGGQTQVTLPVTLG